MEKIQYNFWCQDCNCGRKVKDQTFIFEITKEESKAHHYCEFHKDEINQMPLKLMGQNTGTANINLFSSLSNQEKARVLKKRSHDHYKKVIEPRKKDDFL